MTTEAVPTNGQIDVMTYFQNNILGAGLHCSNNPAHYGFNTSGVFSTDANLNDFHNYSIEWNKSEVKWFFDHINYLTININQSLGKKSKHFHRPSRLSFHLGVGGGDGNNYFFPDQNLVLEDVIN